MWEFLTMVYKGDLGGLGIFLAFGCLCSAVGKIGAAIFKREK